MRRFSAKRFDKAIHRRALLIGALACLGQGVLPPVRIPGIGPADPRVAVDAAQAPWWAVGRVQTELGGRCTGFLVGPSTALTAAHCLYYARSRHYLRPGSIHFVTGYARGEFTGHARAVAFRIAPGYDPLRQASSAGADWAVLTLDNPLGAAGHVLTLLPAPVAIGDPVVLAGYGQDREEVMEADMVCNVSGWTADGGNRDIMRHDCAGTPGTSGAPVLIHQHGSWTVIGLEIAAELGQAEGAAIPSFALKP